MASGEYHAHMSKRLFFDKIDDYWEKYTFEQYAAMDWDSEPMFEVNWDVLGEK